MDEEEDTDGDDLRQYLQDMEDPLGIGGEDARKGKPQHDDEDSDEDEDPAAASSLVSPRKAKRMAARKLKGTLDPTDEKFDAVMYLVKVHTNTPIEDLQRGKARLEQKVTSRQKQLEFLVKDNFARFMICKDAVDDIYLTISGQKLNNSAKIVDLATGSFKDLLNRSRGVFSPLLDRQTEIDRIKSVLGILKRSQFIFNLPRRMRDNIAAGEYSKVVLNYKKVRSLVATASHASIKNVVSEVDAIIRELHTTLFEHLEQTSSTLKQQEEYIKLLVELGSPVDPAWYSLELRHSRMKGLLLERAAKANPVPESPHYSLGLAQQQRHAASVILTTSAILQENMPQYLQLANNFFGRTYHKSLSEKKKNALSDQHSLNDFLAKLHELFSIYSDIVIKSFYGGAARTMVEAAAIETRTGFSSFIPSSTDSSASAASASSKTALQAPTSPAMIVTGRKKKTRSRTNTRSASVEQMKPIPLSASMSDPKLSLIPSPSPSASSTAATATTTSNNLVHSVASAGDLARLVPTQTPSPPQPLVVVDEPMLDKERVLAIYRLYQQLQDVSPAEWLSPLADLLDLVRRTFIKELFFDVLWEAKTWYSQEDWVVLDQQRMITALPGTFESALTSTMERLKGLVTAEDPLIVYIQKRFIECIECFADNIHHLAFVNANVMLDAIQSPREAEDDGSGSDHDSFNSNRYDIPTMTTDARLLIALNNCTFAKKTLIPSLLEKFQTLFGIELYNPTSKSSATQLLVQLEDMILRKYVCHKTNALNEIIRAGVLFSGFDWGGIKAAPTGIRDFIMTTLLELVFIHDELHRVSRSLVRPVLTTVLENIYQCFIDGLQYIDTISNHGVLQIGMELEFISSIMRKYRSTVATGLANELDHLLQYNNIMDPKSDEVLAKDKKIVKGLVSSKLQEAALLVECFTGRDASDLTL